MRSLLNSVFLMFCLAICVIFWYFFIFFSNLGVINCACMHACVCVCVPVPKVCYFTWSLICFLPLWVAGFFFWHHWMTGEGADLFVRSLGRFVWYHWSMGYMVVDLGFMSVLLGCVGSEGFLWIEVYLCFDPIVGCQFFLGLVCWSFWYYRVYWFQFCGCVALVCWQWGGVDANREFIICVLTQSLGWV